MKSAIISLVGVVSLGLSMAASADCAFPKAPDAIPDGKSASEADMITAMSAFKQYNIEVDSYLTCLDQETSDKIRETAGAGAIMQIKALQQKKRGSATDERQAKVENFNNQVRAFKSRKS
jgi:hypothetical protein